MIGIGVIMIRVVLVDLDGTVYEGNNVIDGAVEAISNMRNNGIKVIFCTNNSSLPPEKIVEKMNRMGVVCEDDELISSIGMMVAYLKNNAMKKVYVCGSDEVVEYCKFNKIDLCSENECENLVIAMDKKYNYEKMTRGTHAALRADKILICNQDALFPTEEGLCPGCGAMVSSILFCSNRKADVIIGKPSTYMLEYVCEKYGYDKDDLLVIGDTPDSDIKMADDFGCKSLLVDISGTVAGSVKGLKDTVSWDWSKFSS